MNIVVLVKMVPDLVEELSIDDSGIRLDRKWMRLIINEFDDHSIEQAILIKEKIGGQVTVIAPDLEGTQDVLFTAAAKGADNLIMLAGDFDEGISSHALARAYMPIVREINPDIILTGVQANDDLDGSVGPLLAAAMDIPYVGYVSGVSVADGTSTVKKEYPGGLIAEMEVKLPALLGIQAAEQPPRYVAISKVRQAMKTAVIDERSAGQLAEIDRPVVERMFQPEAGARATMLEGDEEEIAAQIIEILQDRGIL